MKLPRIMIAAIKSGSGKTIITCGLLKLLKDRGIDVRSYKCGPDYIDPMFHRSVIGVPGGNLDTFFSSDDEICGIVASSGCETAVMEGVMGIYDGITGGSRGSCYDVAAATDTPVILIVDVKGMGQTMLSVIKGILADDRQELIKGIILNRVSERYFREISPALADMLAAVSEERGAGVLLLGGIPNVKDIKLESRHLGLMMPGEIDDLKDQVSAAAGLISEHIDMEGLLGIMAAAGELPDAACRNNAPDHGNRPLTLAVARDEAFCFYYEENLRMLRELGIVIKEFSPVHDNSIPEDADGLLLGGGYPELCADRLSPNSSMMDSIRNALSGGMPCLAECGGFMTLMEELEDSDGRTWTMAGVIPGRTYFTGKLSRFGYVIVSGKAADNGEWRPGEDMLKGLRIRGHEFHYFDSTNNGSDAVAEKPDGRSWECIHSTGSCIMGYPHLYYPSCPELVRRFRSVMEVYREGRG